MVLGINSSRIVNRKEIVLGFASLPSNHCYDAKETFTLATVLVVCDMASVTMVILFVKLTCV